jgi:hypothetical protein
MTVLVVGVEGEGGEGEGGEDEGGGEERKRGSLPLPLLARRFGLLFAVAVVEVGFEEFEFDVLPPI